MSDRRVKSVMTGYTQKRKRKKLIIPPSQSPVALFDMYHLCAGTCILSVLLGMYLKVRGVSNNEAVYEFNDFTWLNSIPHNRTSFTQGLSFYEGILYEGTGLFGESNIFQIDPRNGNILKQSLNPLPLELFGEGIAHFHGKLIQLTWKNNLGFIYNASTLEVLFDSFEFDTSTGEGWGITYDPINNEFIVSDGSHHLHFWDANTLKEKRRIQVYRTDSESGEQFYISRLNELEFLNGRILANIWYTDFIVSINPVSGEVEKIYDLTQLWPMSERAKEADCLNGISVTDIPGEVYLTGKLWPEIHRIRLHEF